MLAKTGALIGFGLFSAALVGCSAGAVQRDAICERSSALDIAVVRSSELSKGVKGQNAAVLQNQIDEDLANLVAALDVAPPSISGDIATIADRLRSLYGALELVDWDASRFVSDEDVANAVAQLSSVNTRRHQARITGYLLRSCDDGNSDALPPPDSIVQIPPSSTSVVAVGDDPVPVDQDLLTAHVAMGSAIADSIGATVTVDEAECLGREADAISLSAEQIEPGSYDRLFGAIFIACGVNVPDRPKP